MSEHHQQQFASVTSTLKNSDDGNATAADATDDGDVQIGRRQRVGGGGDGLEQDHGDGDNDGSSIPTKRPLQQKEEEEKDSMAESHANVNSVTKIHVKFKLSVVFPLIGKYRLCEQ